MKRKLIWFICLLLLFVSSYYREVLFRSINAIMGGEDFFYAKTTTLPFLMDWSYAELNRLKYLLTVGFSAWFILLSLVGLRKGFDSNLAYWLLMGGYILIAVIAGIAMVIGFAFLDFQTVYPFLRKLIGIIHNPLPYLLISIGVYGVEVVRGSEVE
jgi:hypothetical protein